MSCITYLVTRYLTRYIPIILSCYIIKVVYKIKFMLQHIPTSQMMMFEQRSSPLIQC